MYFDINFSIKKLYVFVSNFCFDFTLNKKRDLFSNRRWNKTFYKL